MKAVVENAALSRLMGVKTKWLMMTRAKDGSELVHAQCTMPGCVWVGNSRRENVVARDDMLRHARIKHNVLLQKHERDIERSIARRKENNNE